MNRLSVFLLVCLGFGLFRCDDDEADLYDIQQQLEEATNANKALTFTNILLSRTASNVLITEVRQEGVNFKLTFEGGETLETDTAVVSSYEVDSDLWTVDFVLNDGSEVQAGFVSGVLNIAPAAVVLDPYRTAPLSAIINVTTPVMGKMKITVKGKKGPASDITKSFSSFTNNHELMVLGLYSGTLNNVDIVFTNKEGLQRAKSTVQIQTSAINSAELPEIEITSKATNFINGYILFDFRLTNLPMIVDQFGDIRWYLRKGPTVVYGLQRLANGNIAYGASTDSEVVEYDMMGRKVMAWSVLPDYKNVHHDVFELPNGNFLVSVDKVGSQTIEDRIIELDRTSGAIKTVWNLELILPKREQFIADPVDWFHNNAIAYDPNDNTLLLSGQRMGIVKVTWDNKLKWILTQPEGWPAEFEPYLLKSSDPNMEWIWGQHAPLVMPNGNLFLFDNGYGRHYGNSDRYSRAAEFVITENTQAGGNVSLAWEYGKDRGLEMHSPIISDVDYIPESNSRFITSGSIGFALNYVSNTDNSGVFTTSPIKAKMIEVDQQKNVLFEMTIRSNQTAGSVYRSEKLRSIYPN
jgi:arylsulfate sulfotransferase